MFLVGRFPRTLPSSVCGRCDPRARPAARLSGLHLIKCISEDVPNVLVQGGLSMFNWQRLVCLGCISYKRRDRNDSVLQPCLSYKRFHRVNTSVGPLSSLARVPPGLRPHPFVVSFVLALNKARRSSQHSTCLASQESGCLGSQQGTCLASQQ